MSIGLADGWKRPEQREPGAWNPEGLGLTMTGKLRLPSLNALRVFHAVAQHKSIRQASDELLVTPQAVGQQIKLLEDTLQVTLFERKGRSIELTESATRSSSAA